MNKAIKTLNAARSDHWEAGYFCEGSKNRMRRDAKRTAKRARRRLTKALIAEQI